MRVSLAPMALWCAFTLAQSPTAVFTKAPPGVDEALRARIKIFYQAHVDGNFRQAESVVAEDSKDAYYNAEKRRFLGFEIADINYSERFTKAIVITAVDMEWTTTRLGKLRVKPPVKTLWKQENGQWYWYVLPEKDWDTPFGKMEPGSEPGAGRLPRSFPDAQAILSQVKTSKQEVQLISDKKSEDFIEISNSMPGEITLRIDAPLVPGLAVKLDESTVKSGGSARIRFQFEPPDALPKKTAEVHVLVQQTGARIPIQVNFAPPPGFERFVNKQAPGSDK